MSICKKIFLLSGMTIALSTNNYAETNSTASTLIPIIEMLLLGNENSWGSKNLNNSDRPDRSWLNNFNSATLVQATSDLDAAQTDCPLNGYCIIEINQLTLNEPAYIWRPQTKFLGKPGNTITYAGSPGDGFNFFEICSGATDCEDIVNEVAFEGLHIDGRSINYSADISAIYLYGSNINKIAIINNNINNIYSSNNAHAIAVYGTGITDNSAIKDVIIEGNQIKNMLTGYSESIALNGNIKNWEVKNNTINNVNNIAIDAIGGEGTSPTTTQNERTLPGEFDAARYGFIENNTVDALHKNHEWVAAIYVDGGRFIHMENNNVSDSEWGYEIGAENCISTNNVTMSKYPPAKPGALEYVSRSKRLNRGANATLALGDTYKASASFPKI